MLNNFSRQACGSGCAVFVGRVPERLMPTKVGFDELWRLHPDEFPQIKIRGQLVRTPRWQQAFGEDYRFSGQISRALPVSPVLGPLLQWSREAIDPRLNGLLVNWYDGRLGHYIGPHRDSTTGLIPGTPIVTMSFGEERVLRLRKWEKGKTSPPVDLVVTDGSVVVIPWETNMAFTHEVPRLARYRGRRVSVTMRAFVRRSRTPGQAQRG
jgi:alkylated DNA repair dioxygenase AlkB